MNLKSCSADMGQTKMTKIYHFDDYNSSEQKQNRRVTLRKKSAESVFVIRPWRRRSIRAVKSIEFETASSDEFWLAASGSHDHKFKLFKNGRSNPSVSLKSVEDNKIKMPLVVKDFTWLQTEEMVTVRIPLKGVSPSSVDIFTSDNYIKANYSPFLFEVFLNSSINETASKCTISDTEIIFELQKTIPKLWETLTADITKLEMLEKRKEIIERQHQKTEEERKARKEKLANLQRLSVQQQIERDTKNRGIIEDRRNAEKKKAMDELDEWAKASDSQQRDAEVASDMSKIIFEESESGIEIKNLSEEVSKPEEGDSRANSKVLSNGDLDVFPMPLPRSPGKITVKFTHRDFPTPSRESQAPQEEEWLKKQVEARRATGFVAEDLRPEECNPTWLKDKGDSFYKVGNYLGAVSAYTHAIKLGSKMASLYSNRGAAHLGLGNLHKALDDCSQALELMTPHVPANLESRAKCHARRGAILCRLGLPEAGLADFEEALKLMPNDSKLQQDIERAKSMVRNKPLEEEKFDGVEIIPS